MFLLRSIFWLTVLVMLLPPAERGGDPPRVDIVNGLIAAQALVKDVAGMCERNPAACAVSREAIGLVGRKIETGAGIVAAGMGRSDSAERGTLKPSDLEPDWSAGSLAVPPG